VEKRLYKYLIDKSNIMKDKTLIITHQEIAEDNHTSRVVVSRLLKRLENDGQITIRRNRIIIEK
jgi:CRP/FNR family transcriptional regulator